MIGFISGKLLEKAAPILIVDVGGVGYEVQAPLNIFHRLPDLGGEVRLFTHFISREDGQFLFGFVDREQRELFRTLIKVNGVGPKMALAILSSIEPDSFINHILNNETAQLERIPGVGAKTASRLIVELRDKVSEFSRNTKTVGTHINAELDAISALISLGYKPNEARQAVARHKDKNIASEDLIRLALKDIK